MISEILLFIVAIAVATIFIIGIGLMIYAIAGLAYWGLFEAPEPLNYVALFFSGLGLIVVGLWGAYLMLEEL